MFRACKIMFISLTMLFWIYSFCALPPSALKELASCFHDPRLSPLQGAMLWESGVVKNYYDAGTLYPPTKARWLNHPDGPIRLARSLFALNAGNFDVSNNTNYPAFHMAPSTIAHIIVYLEQHKELTVDQLEELILRDQAFVHSLASTRQEYEIISKRYDIDIQHAQANAQLSLKESRAIALSKLDTQRLCRTWEHLQRTIQAKNRIAQIDQLRGKEKQQAQKERARIATFIEQAGRAETGGDYNRVAECARAIVDSVTNCNAYPSSIAQWLLLAFAYRKAHHKSELADYINCLASQLKPAPCHAVDEAWHTNNYLPDDALIIQVQFLDKPIHTTVLTNYELENLAYASIIERFYAGPLPKIAEYKTIKWHDQHFADCTETTLRNFCNMVLYDRNLSIFDLSKSPNNHPSPQLNTFYLGTNAQSVFNVELQELYDRWGSLMRHQPLITYRSMIMHTENGQDIMLKAPLDCMGFIYGLPEQGLARHPEYSDRIIIGSRSYIVVDPDKAYLCEMHPTLRNFIITLDRLFDLGIFENKNLSKEFLNPHFNALYMPQLCQHFNQLTNHKFSQTELEELDAHEYTHKGIRINFEHFDLTLTNDHAEIIPHSCDSSFMFDGRALLNKLIQTTDEQRDWQRAQLLALLPVATCQIPHNTPYAYLLYCNIQKPYTKIEFIRHCLAAAHNHSDSDRLVALAAAQLSLLPQRLDWMYHRKLIPILDRDSIQLNPIKQVFDSIVAHAMNLFHEPTDRRSHVPLLLRELVKKGYYFNESTFIAQEYIKSNDGKERKRALKLFACLVNQQQALDQARQAVALASSCCPKEQSYALTLKKLLDS